MVGLVWWSCANTKRERNEAAHVKGKARSSFGKVMVRGGS